MVFLAMFITQDNLGKIDFGNNKAGKDWQIVNDDVMGGRSQSKILLTNNSLLFKGSVSLENNGGFASIRAPWGKYDLSKYTTMTMRCRGTARQFAVTMQNESVFYRPNFKYFFTPNPEEWQTFELQLADFKAHQMGRVTGETIAAEQLAEIIRFGIILYDKQAGTFELEIDYIGFE
jgi:hypothetical protein